MKKFLKYGLLILIVTVLTDCSKKAIYVCGTGSKGLIPFTNGYVLQYKSLGIADTTLALIKGNVLGNYWRTDSLVKEVLPNLSIKIKNAMTADSIYASTNENGYYQFYLKPGIYICYATFEGFENLILHNIVLKSGEVKQLDFLLGQNGGTTELNLPGLFTDK